MPEKSLKFVEIIETAETELAPTREPEPEGLPLPETHYSERCTRFFLLIIYLCGLSGLGFALSFYYIFFWDSKMPPVYKSFTKKPFF